MPHIAITMILGRDDETKRALALQTQAFPVRELSRIIKRSPDEIMFVKPGV